ncbi:MAG: hypothetical protein IIY16_03210 [Oscillospiraceae bacterium]|nr:hypothetical protein [Oscillospiraceae bacterium]
MAFMYMTGDWYEVWEPLIYGVGGFIPGMCFVGFAEIIKLLQRAVDLLTPDSDKADVESEQENAESDPANP